MRRLFFIALSFLAVLSTGAKADDCTLHQYASLPIVANANNMAVVEAQIGGHTYHLMVDTGGVYSMLQSDVANSLKLSQYEIRSSEVYDAAGKRIRNYVEAPDFKLGPIVLEKFPMMVETDKAVHNSFEGTLGVDFLSRFDVEIDSANRKLNLFSPDHCTGKVVYWAKSYADVTFTIHGTNIVVPLTLDGKSLNGVLDTGSSGSTINKTIAYRVFGLGETSPDVEHLSDAKPDDLIQYRFRFKSLDFNGVSVSNPLLFFLPDNGMNGLANEHPDKLVRDPIYGADFKAPDLILGMDVLSPLHLYISYKEKTLYVTAADAH